MNKPYSTVQDRHLCTIAGCLLSYGYTAAAWHLARFLL